MTLFILKLLALFGSVPWVFGLVGTLLMKQYVSKFEKVTAKSVSGLPRLSILIPACNEEDTIEASLQSLMRQTYPNFEVVVINDRSTDNTGAVAESFAQRDSRIRVVHIDHLPNGWLGKVHALHVGSQQATGEWMLFTDADIHFSRDCLQRAVTHSIEEGLDHLTLIPKMTSISIFARFSIISAMRTILVVSQPWHVNDPNRPEGLGIGAFNLIRTRAFQDTAGFEYFKMDVADDLALGQLMKQTGSSQVFRAHKDVSVEWYPSVKALFLGMEKNAFAQIARCDLRVGLTLAAAYCWIALSPWVLWMMGERFWACIPLLAAFWTSTLLAETLGVAFFEALGSFLFGDLLLVGVLVRSTWLGHERGGVIWRGTVYSSQELREGMKYEFGAWITRLLKLTE